MAGSKPVSRSTTKPLKKGFRATFSRSSWATMALIFQESRSTLLIGPLASKTRIRPSVISAMKLKNSRWLW